MKHDLVIYEEQAPANCPEHGVIKGNMVHRVYDSRIGKSYLLCGRCIDETVLPLCKSGQNGEYNVIDRRDRGRIDEPGNSGADKVVRAQTGDLG